MKKIFLQQEKQEILNIITALQFYRDNAISSKNKPQINNQIDSIVGQLKIQEITIYTNQQLPKFNFGDKVKYEEQDAIIVGMADDMGFIKIAIFNGELKTIDVPEVLINK
jgi:hypothetical protein